MTAVPVEFVSFVFAGPERYSCALLHWKEEDKYLIIWTDPDATDMVMDHENQLTQRQRPSSATLLFDVLSICAGGVKDLCINSYYDGIFSANIVTEEGHSIDARALDVLAMVYEQGLPLSVTEDILNQYALRLTEEELLEYLPHRQFDEDECEENLLEEFLDEDTASVGLGSDESAPKECEDSEPEGSGEELDNDFFHDLLKQMGVNEEDLDIDDPER